MKCKRCSEGPFGNQYELAAHGRHCDAQLPIGMGACSNCGVLPEEQFYKIGDGWCKECYREYSRTHKSKTPEEQKEHNKQLWQQRKNDPVYRDYYRNYMKKWRKTPQAKRNRATSRQRRRALVNGLNEHFTTDEFADLIITYDQACPHCYQREPTIHITPDHVQALANGGANSIDNIQPLCWGQNEKSTNKNNYDFRKGHKALWFNLVFSTWFVPSTSPGTRKLPKGIKAYTLSEVASIAQQRRYKLTSAFYANFIQTLDFVCPEGHLWQTSFKNFQNHNCPACEYAKLGQSKRKTVEEISTMLQEAHLELSLVSAYHDMHTLVRWKCNVCSYEFDRTPMKVLHAKQGCSRCSGNRGRTITLDEVRELAKSLGGNLLSTKYTDNKTPLRWSCKHGNEFARPYGDVKKHGLKNTKNCRSCKEERYAALSAALSTKSDHDSPH